MSTPGNIWSLTAEVRVLNIDSVLLGFQEHLDVDPPGLGWVVNESRWDLDGDVGLVRAKAQVQEQLLRILMPEVQHVHDTAVCTWDQQGADYLKSHFLNEKIVTVVSTLSK